MIYPVILCGGTGGRLWPLSRALLHIIEVQSGTYRGEDDIVRFADDYKRP